MRAALIVLALLVAVPAVGAGYGLKIHNHMVAPGWFVDAFTTDANPWITIRVGISADGEFVGSALALYDGNDAFLGSILLASKGGQIVDLEAHGAGAAIDNAGWPGLVRNGLYEQTVRFLCDANCNPSRSFKLAVSGAGDLHSWGYGVFFNGTTGAKLNGTQAWAMTSRDFEQGTHAFVGTPFGGSMIALDSTHTIPVTDHLIGGFVKPGPRAERMSVLTPSGTVQCTCFFNHWPAGSYTLQYADKDTRGEEGLFIAADIRLA